MEERIDPSGAFVWTTYAALQSLQAGLNSRIISFSMLKYNSMMKNNYYVYINENYYKKASCEMLKQSEVVKQY